MFFSAFVVAAVLGGDVHTRICRVTSSRACSGAVHTGRDADVEGGRVEVRPMAECDKPLAECGRPMAECGWPQITAFRTTLRQIAGDATLPPWVEENP